MNKEHKARIRGELLKVIPKDWKWGLTIARKTTIHLTIKSAPVDLCGDLWEKIKKQKWPPGTLAPKPPLRCFGLSGDSDLNELFSKKNIPTFEKIVATLNLDNNDNASTDGSSVGHDVEISVGTSARPFIFDEATILTDVIARPRGKNRKRIRV